MNDSDTRLVKDQLEREIEISFPPQRIISLVPSQTELLFDLGLDEEVIGITKFCVHPSTWFRAKTRLGGTKNLHLNKIISLNPDLIIANKEENVAEQIDELSKHFPLWISDVKNLDDAFTMIHAIGGIVNRKSESENLVARIKKSIRNWQSGIQISKHWLCAYMIWQNPLMTVGSDTFIQHMLGIAGFENIFSDCIRYPEISMEELQKRNPEFILLSSEPFPFKQKDADELKLHLPNSKIILVDGEMFSWYGSRLLKAPEYFRQLFESIDPTSK
ncbi:MAG: ABC transporter substrate-binding protein [Chitinophagales bacterium]